MVTKNTGSFFSLKISPAVMMQFLLHKYTYRCKHTVHMHFATTFLGLRHCYWDIKKINIIFFHIKPSIESRYGTYECIARPTK